MSHHPVREEKKCLNCGQEVPARFCGNCGQENVETRMSFLSLVAHFFEDLTHYEGKFWKTLHHLFFKPGRLTISFLEGKRNSSLPPVRLYIFVSFLTFFLAHILPTRNTSNEDKSYTVEQLRRIDSMRYVSDNNFHYSSEYGLIMSSIYKTKEELDSARLALEGTENEIDLPSYWGQSKAIQLRNKMPNELWDMFLTSFGNNIPKTLFFYLPIFALVIGIFYRKQHVYFDHAVFTLHYFSFLLLSICLYIILGNIAGWIIGAHDDTDTYLVKLVLLQVISIWIFVYFLIAQKVVYKEKTFVFLVKSLFAFFINLGLFIFVFIGLLFVTLMMLH